MPVPSRHAEPPATTLQPPGRADATNAPACLALSNVACTGGSWMVPQERLAAADWAGMTGLVAAAAALRGA